MRISISAINTKTFVSIPRVIPVIFSQLQQLANIFKTLKCTSAKKKIGFFEKPE